MSKFLECFPPLRAAWRPVTESRLIVELCGSRIRVQGKVDLTIGTADGLRAGKVIIDLKSGVASTSHRDDLRFYALLETIRIGVPPRLIASYYLDQGIAHTEAGHRRPARSDPGADGRRRTPDRRPPQRRGRTGQAAGVRLPLVPAPRRLHRGPEPPSLRQRLRRSRLLR